jgi:hypothetical protein
VPVSGAQPKREAQGQHIEPDGDEDSDSDTKTTATSAARQRSGSQLARWQASNETRDGQQRPKERRNVRQASGQEKEINTQSYGTA